MNNIDEVIVKIWDMSQASNESVVRTATLEWARDELKKLIEQARQEMVRWLEGDCTEHPHQVYPTGIGYDKRIDCPDCQQELKRKWGVK